MTAYTLKPGVLVEPTFNSWYAWSLLLFPPTAALVTRNLHLRLLQSYHETPELHALAAGARSLQGGMFVAGQPAVEHVIRCLDHTRSRLAPLIELGNAIDRLRDILAEQAKGFSLEGIYREIPDALKGYVELVYDLENRASIRFLERLFYEPPYFVEDAQAIVLTEGDEEQRPFVLSSPRFAGERDVTIRKPFAAPALDRLFRSRRAPLDRAGLMALGDDLGVGGAVFESLFVPDAAGREVTRRRSPASGLNVSFFGHAALLIETRSAAVLLDPLISYGSAAGEPRFTYQDLPEDIDYVAVTHAHQDHFVLESLLQVRGLARGAIVPRNTSGALQDPSLALMLEKLGFPNVRALGALDEIRIGEDARIVGIPFLGEHGDLDIASKIGYCIEADGVKIVCLADSTNLDAAIYERVAQRLGKVDALFLGMECSGAPMSWLYGPLMSKPATYKMDQSRRLNASDCARALELVRIFGPRAVFVYAMGMEPWVRHISSLSYDEDAAPIVESNRLIAQCRGMGLLAERLAGRRQIAIGRDRIEVV